MTLWGKLLRKAQDKLPKQYKAIFTSFKLYWKIYGGWHNFFRSPYLHFAILISFIIYPMWHPKSCYPACYMGKVTPWFDLIISVLPGILGFTLGGYAILLAFGDEKFRQIIAGQGKDGNPSPFMVLNGAFIHFIIVQGFSIIFAIIGKSWGTETGVLAWFGSVCFIYSILTAVAAAMAILNIADWFDTYKSQD